MATLTKIWNFLKALPRAGKEVILVVFGLLIILWEARGKKKG